MIRRRFPRPLMAVVAAFGLALTSLAVRMQPSPAVAAPPGPRAEHVVLIGFDGFDPDYLGRVPTPNIDALAARGASGVTEGVMLPITNPSFTALTTGAWPDRSGNAAYWWDKAANTYRGQSRANDVTSIAEAVVDGGGTVGSAQYFILQGNGADYGNPSALYTQPGGTCERHFDDAIAMLNGTPVESGGATVTVPEIPTLLAVYCGDLDAIGHDEGAESPNLDATLMALDAQVGRLVAEVEDAGIADTTTIVLAGDHGMSTYTQTFGFPLYTAVAEAGYTPQFLFAAGQSVNAGTDVVIIAAGRSLSIYLAGPLAGDEAALADLRSIAENVEGTGAIHDKADQAAMHMNSHYGDLVVESEPGWGAGILPPSGPRGDHGSTDEVGAVFVIAGAGIAQLPGEVAVRHVDVAPTIAELLGLPPLPDADGTALTRLFERSVHGFPIPVASTTTGSTTTSTVPTTTGTTNPDSTTSTTMTSITTSTTSTDPAVDAGRSHPDVGPATPAQPRRGRPSYTG